MNTNHLEKFAQEARRKLLEQVGAKLSFVLNTDSAELREKTEQLKQLRDELGRTTKEELIEKVAYTWFNRLMALRFMDANDYQPLGIRVITPKDGYTIPELFDEAKRGNIPEELRVNRKKVYELLDNQLPSKNPQNEAFKELLIGACNHLNTTLPFLFEKINDYTELLLPNDLTSDFSIVTDIREGMPADDCKNVEIIGWLYQFYISEENERLIKEKKTYKKNELAPASQLFTPKWIVQYMVDNTLGQLLTEIYPTTTIIKQLEYYIKPADIELIKSRTKKRIEEITFFDPCVGSAHILSYAFDVYYMIYKEQGYNETEIPELIIRHNLFGTDIDERAAQLSSFVLMMKGRQYYSRFLKKEIRPNIAFYQDIEFDNKFKNASSIGSLIKVEPEGVNSIVIDEGSLFSKRQQELKRIYGFLGQQYDIVVTNPPYIGSSRMEGTLKQYVETNYPETKYDLFATFILRCLELCNDDGFTGYMSPFVWMFIASYEELRKIIINKFHINNLIQLEYSGFEGATVPICTFTIRKKLQLESFGNYIRLTDFKGAKIQSIKVIEAIRNPKVDWFYTFRQEDFKKIPKYNLGYWLSDAIIESFNKALVQDYCKAKAGICTGVDADFIKIWSEVSQGRINFGLTKYERSNKTIWIPINKGGEFRRYYGNCEHIINIWNLWTEGRTNQSVRRGDPDYYFREAITWTYVTSSKSSFRKSRNKVFATAAPAIFFNDSDKIDYVLGLLNSKVVDTIIPALNPTLNLVSGDILQIPVIIEKELFEYINQLLKLQMQISKEDWDSRETSWEFQKNELLRIDGQDIEESFDLYQQHWKNKFVQLHQNEEDLNRKFIKIYGLQNELTPNVTLEEITVLQEELDRQVLTKINNKLIRSTENNSVINYSELMLPFTSKEIASQFISYSIGCIFGRYSLDKEGLILANQGETLQDYKQKIAKSNDECIFLPDEDNIIPILEDEWFEDDIVGLFKQFLKVTFGEKNFNKNLVFLEEQIGKDIRKYFTRDLYSDHIKRYRKRPIYWMFSSAKGSFNVLIYMHRYTPDTVSNILNKYLKEFIGKLNTRKEHLQNVQVTGSASDKTKAIKETDNIEKILVELHEYERDVLFPLATERIEIDLDDGVLVNYNKFGKAVKEVNGLNDTVTKKKVKQFDWIDSTQIR